MQSTTPVRHDWPRDAVVSLFEHPASDLIWQTLFFPSGNVSIFSGEDRVITGDPNAEHDRGLFRRLGGRTQSAEPAANKHVRAQTAREALIYSHDAQRARMARPAGLCSVRIDQCFPS